MDALATLDWILLAALVLSVLLGAWRGLMFEVLSVLAWVLAFVAAQLYAHDAGQALPLASASEELRHAAGFVLVFVGVVFAGGLIAALIKRLMQAVGLRPADRVLGALFGALRGLVLLLALVSVVALTPARAAPQWQASLGVSALERVMQHLLPILPSEFRDLLADHGPAPAPPHTGS